MRKMRKPSDEEFQFDRETDSKLRNEVQKIYERQTGQYPIVQGDDSGAEADSEETGLAVSKNTRVVVPSTIGGSLNEGKDKRGLPAEQKESGQKLPTKGKEIKAKQSGGNSRNTAKGNSEDKKKKKKKKASAGDIIYKIIIVLMILGCIALIPLCIKFLIASENKEITYVYSKDGTTGYEAPEGVTILEGETGNDEPYTYETQDQEITIVGTIFVEEESESEAESEEDDTTAELQTEAEETETYTAIDTDGLEPGLYYDVFNE